MSTASTLRSVFKVLFKLLTRTEVQGQENVPQQGAFILATNHMSRIDVPLLLIATPRDDLIALVANTYRSNPFFHLMVIMSGSIYIDREKADFTAMRAGMDFLRKGGVLGIAPEGTRSRVGALIQAKNGVALLAEKTHLPVVPTAISGTEDGVKRLLTLRKPILRVAFGEPVQLAPVSREDRETNLQRNTDEIMCRIAALLPEKYRGAYAGHPRLKELTSQPG